jgi:hypothetical protein
MSVTEIEFIFENVFNYLKPFLFSLDGSKNPFHGKIPFILSSPFIMGRNALEKCHHELDITWDQLLDNLTITVVWRGDIPWVIIHHYHEIYNFFYIAECINSIEFKIIYPMPETVGFKALKSLLYDFIRMIMVELTKQQNQTKEDEAEPLCACLFNPNARKPDIVIDLDALLESSTRNKRTYEEMEK